jgi:hypothetical protein
MKNRLIGIAWAIVGGFTIFTLAAWLCAMAFIGLYTLAGKNPGTEVDHLILAPSVLLALWGGIKLNGLFHKGKLPGHTLPEN